MSTFKSKALEDYKVEGSDDFEGTMTGGIGHLRDRYMFLLFNSQMDLYWSGMADVEKFEKVDKQLAFVIDTLKDMRKTVREAHAATKV